MSRFDAAIIIPHYNDVVRLSRCLDALMPQMTLSVEVIVVDNASTQSLDPIKQTFPSLRMVIEPRKGAAEARNRGVAETTADRLFFLDCDCIPSTDWLETALQIAPRADIIGGSVTVFDETAPPRTGAQAFEAVFAFDNQFYVEERGFSVTANLLTRRDVFDSTGPFIHGVSEDVEWCRRATAQGFGLSYSDALRVSHPSRGDWSALKRKWLRLNVESFGVNGTDLTGRAKWALKALAMPASVLAHLPRVLNSPALPNVKEKARAILTLLRLRMARMAWMLAQAIRGA